MMMLVVMFVLVFSLTFLAAPTLGSGWFWELGNGLGFAAFAGLLYLVASGRLTRDVRIHRIMAQCVLLVVLAHVFWFLLGDAAVVEFMKPGAPAYMWFGIAGMALLGALVLAPPLPEGRRATGGPGMVRRRHGLLAVAVILAAAGHVVGSQFYLRAPHQVLLFVLLAAAACSGRVPMAGAGADPGAASAAKPITIAAFYLGYCLLFAFLFSAIRNLMT